MPVKFEIKTGDIFTEQVEALVNAVNCVGAMGRGIALQFKRRFPDNFEAYAALCERGELQPGRVFVFERHLAGRQALPRYIINFPTKRHWRDKSRIADIESGLASLVEEIRSRNIRSIALPALGAGLGGLNWAEVRDHARSAVEGLNAVRVILFAPESGPAAKEPNRAAQAPAITAGRTALVILLDRYLRVGLDPYVTSLEAHKLMYFMQAVGEPLSLTFAKGLDGPYAEKLQHVLNAIEGHLVSGFVDADEPSRSELALVPGAVEAAQAFMEDRPEVQFRIARVLELVEGFETSFGLELLATVHWLVAEEEPSTFDGLVQLVYAWNERKQQFSVRQLGIAVDVLSRQGWIAPLAGREFPQPVPVS